MEETLDKLNQEIESLAVDIVMLDPEDISGLGKTLKSLELIEDLSKPLVEDALISVIPAIKDYVETVIMGEAADLSPLETGISQLQEICRILKAGGTYDKDLPPIITSLSDETAETDDIKAVDSNDQELEGEYIEDQPDPSETDQSPGPVSEEDKEIIIDFVAESLENLGMIEVELMDLEQDPNNVETINSIFRPFHTVKGVSGFLNFNKINKLAHVAENLLDKARNGEFTIDGEIIDTILDSVDLLKRMIENLRSSLDTGVPLEGDVDTEPLMAQIQYFISQTEISEKPPLGEMLVSKGAVTETELEEALDVQKDTQDKKIGQILVEKKKVKTKEVVSALRDQKRVARPTTLQVKVDTVKLDNIVDMVGELAIAQSMLRQNELVQSNGDRKLYQITNQLSLITSGLQNTAMSLRMVPIKNTFQKMVRLVRDLAKKAGKEVRLDMFGEDTEIDRNMVEEIYEPMVHMIRNSIDHGLESPELREELNKSRQGNIHLKAYHKGGNIVIEIEDDGQGLNREKILKKAVSTGLVKEDDHLTDAEIDHLIFHPGFSTAEKITDISGRGVGTDVVRSTIEKLRGTIEVQSVTGKGTTFFLRLPLTLAIVDGMIIKIADERFIIPTLSVQESFRPKQKEYHTVKGKGEMIQVRDSLIPLVRLDQLIRNNGDGLQNESDKMPWERLVVVVENKERQMCLLVDELLGQEEVVIKNLGGWLRDVKGIAGSTIMGDGKVGLILDIAGIYQMTAKEK